MNDATRAQLFFKQYALEHNFKYKVAGDRAYSSKPMGMDKYIRLISARNNVLIFAISELYLSSKRISIKIPKEFES